MIRSDISIVMIRFQFPLRPRSFWIISRLDPSLMAPKDVFHGEVTVILHNPFRDWLSSIRFHPIKIHHHVYSKSSAVVTMRRGEAVAGISNAVNPLYHTWELVYHRFRTIDGDLLASRAATGESGLYDSTRWQAAFESAGARTLS